MHIYVQMNWVNIKVKPVCLHSSKQKKKNMILISRTCWYGSLFLIGVKALTSQFSIENKGAQGSLAEVGNRGPKHFQGNCLECTKYSCYIKIHLDTAISWGYRK